MAPSVLLQGRQVTTTWLYEDPDHPDRVTGTRESPAWTDDDLALLLALQRFEDTLCPGGCGYPRSIAWHSELDGWFEKTHESSFVCHACSAQQGQEVAFGWPENTMPEERMAALPPFVLGETTTAPEDKPAPYDD